MDGEPQEAAQSRAGAHLSHKYPKDLMEEAEQQEIWASLALRDLGVFRCHDGVRRRQARKGTLLLSDKRKGKRWEGGSSCGGGQSRRLP